MTTGWQPTAALVRSGAGGLILLVAGMLTRQVELVVLAAPLLAAAVWAVLRRPVREPTVDEHLDHRVLREGDTTTWRATVVDHDQPPRIDDVAALLAMPWFAELDPAAGAVTDRLEVAVRPTRWGVRPVGPARVVASSAWAGFRWVSGERRVGAQVVLPQPAVFDAAPTPTSFGLVGLNRSARPGNGTEFAGVRPFQAGDRLRRIHWPRSIRSGELHVTTTWAEEDRHIALVIDAAADIGVSQGVDGRASSLDITVRAAGALAEHFLGRGERVSLHVLGNRGRPTVPPATGRAHLRRVLHRLSQIEPSGVELGRRPRLGIDPGATVIVLSPLVAERALERAVDWSGRGYSVLVIDTLPPGVTDDDPEDPFRGLAWRIRLLERDAEVRRVQRSGVAVVAWRGPGSLDQVLRQLHGRRRAPRTVRR